MFSCEICGENEVKSTIFLSEVQKSKAPRNVNTEALQKVQVLHTSKCTQLLSTAANYSHTTTRDDWINCASF